MQPSNLEDILKEISLSIIPIHDRSIILEMVATQLNSSNSCYAEFVLINKKNINLYNKADKKFPNYAKLEDFFYNQSDLFDVEQIRKNCPCLYNYYESIITEQSLFLPIHSFEELQAIILVIPTNEDMFSTSIKNSLSILLYHLIVAFDRITQIERLENSLKQINQKNKQIQSHNRSLKQRVIEEVEKSTKAFKLIEEISYNRMLTNLNAGIAHEINNPLSIMQLDIDFLEHLIRDKQSMTLKKTLEYINSINHNISKIKEVTGALIKYGLTRSNQKKALCLTALLDDIHLMIKGYASRHNITIQVENKCKHSAVYGDHIRLYQVFMNIIQNSFKALKQVPKKMISIQITKKPNKKICIEFIDSGCGIDKDELSSIFEIKYNEKCITQSDNLGLGLGIVKHIVQDHSGEIYIYSKINKGTTVRLVFDDCSEQYDKDC